MHFLLWLYNNLNISGVERFIFMKQLQTQKPHEIRTKMSLKSSKNPRPKMLNKNVLKKISSEAGKILDRDPNDFDDLVKMAKDHPEHIQYVSRLPFQVISHTENIYASLRKKNAFSIIFYIDGTGSAIKFPGASQRIQIYVLLGYNYLTNTTIPITTFVTEYHSTVQFHNWLNLFRFDFEGKGSKTLFDVVKIINVDWSWALIGGIMRANNKQYLIAEYIQDCYQLCMDIKKPLDFMGIHFCYNHFMKVFANDLKNIKTPIQIRKRLMDCMRLAVRLRNLEDLNKWFRLVVIVFSSKLRTKIFESAYQDLKVFISDQNMGAEENYDEDKPIEKEEMNVINDIEVSFLKEDFYDAKNTKKKRIFKDSPFFHHFNEIYASATNELEASKDPDGSYNDNIFYFPKFLGKLLEKYMSVVCFWSNLVVSRVDGKVEIVSNARIENFFRLLKHSILNDQMNQRVTQFFRKLLEYIESILRLSKLNSEDVFATEGGLERAKKRKIERITKFRNDPMNLEKCVDVWKRPAIARGKHSTHLFQKGHTETSSTSKAQATKVLVPSPNSPLLTVVDIKNSSPSSMEVITLDESLNVSIPTSKKVLKYKVKKVRMSYVLQTKDWIQRFNFHLDFLPYKWRSINFHIEYPNYQNKWYFGTIPGERNFSGE